ncbi:MAG TPA: hypothetical protein VLO13_04635 [Halomonas sp.]|nr:hypothetical protein [Halomonas sp.]
MLGWEFFITRQIGIGTVTRNKDAPVLASWLASVGGTEWLNNLVTAGVAAHLDGNGYPSLYSIPAGALVEVLRDGLPKHDGPLVIGDDYVLPGGWTGDARIDLASLQSLIPNELLLVEVWDQS